MAGCLTVLGISMDLQKDWPEVRGCIKRSADARKSFMKSHPCPATGKTYGACKGYAINHIVPLKRGGADAPSNMQWQTTAEAKAKDRVE